MTSSGCGATPRDTKSSRPTPPRRPPPSLAILARSCAATLDALIAAVVAPACVACGQVLDHPLSGACCAACWASIPPLDGPRCHTCGVPLASWRRRVPDEERCVLCLRRPSAVDRGVVAADYSG